MWYGPQPWCQVNERVFFWMRLSHKLLQNENCHFSTLMTCGALNYSVFPTFSFFVEIENNCDRHLFKHLWSIWVLLTPVSWYHILSFSLSKSIFQSYKCFCNPFLYLIKFILISLKIVRCSRRINLILSLFLLACRPFEGSTL